MEDTIRETKLDSPEFIIHEIALYDTIEGLSLDYGVAVGQLKRINKISSDSIIHLKTLKIPINDFNRHLFKKEIDHEKELKEEKILLVDLLVTEFGTQISRNEIETLVRKSQDDLHLARRYILTHIDHDKMVTHFAVVNGVSDEKARILLSQSGWNYKNAKNLLKDSKSYIQLACTDQKLKID